MAAPAAATCAVCELHAEAVFRVEGMDCNEEVVILERRLKPLDGMVTSTSVGLRAVCGRTDTAAMSERTTVSPAPAISSLTSRFRESTVTLAGSGPPGFWKTRS